MSNEIIKKVELINKIFLNNSTHTYLGENYLKLKGLFGNTLNVDDMEKLVNNSVFINVMFSPASNTFTKLSIPANSALINLDYNSLKDIPIEHSMAILLHEIGHALSPNDQSEFIADDYAIERGYGKYILKSLQESIVDNPKVYDKTITHERISRIK
jgi:hypothetical protein